MAGEIGDLRLDIAIELAVGGARRVGEIGEAGKGAEAADDSSSASYAGESIAG
jgi:hypothetical protein